MAITVYCVSDWVVSPSDSARECCGSLVHVRAVGAFIASAFVDVWLIGDSLGVLRCEKVGNSAVNGLGAGL